MRLVPGILCACLSAIMSCPAIAGPIPAAEGAPRAGYEYWITSSETDSAEQHGIHFRQFVNGSAYRPKYPFHFQRWDDPQLGELNRRLGIDELVRDADSELEAARRIALKVCNLWAHSGPVEYPLWNALGILDQVDQGDQFWCTYKQLVTMQCLASIGIVSRIVPCNWHHSLEYWSNEYGKWVVMDAWTANYYRRDGVPLGALELCRLSRRTGDLKGSGVWEININPNRWQPGRTQDSIPADSPCYQYIRFIPRNDFLSVPLAPKPAGGPEDYLKPNSQINDPLQTGLEHVAWWEPGDAPSIVCPSVRYEQDFNFPLNEVELSLQRPAHREGVLDVTLDTSTPEFDSFYRRVDSGDWTPCGSRQLWELHPGENRLEVKSRNKWGRFGPQSTAVLDYRPEELKAPVVAGLEISDPGFEKTGGRIGEWDGNPAKGWRMVFTDPYQKPAFYGTVKESPHSGQYCFKVSLNEPPIWARLVSGTFRVNQASDVTLEVWLRADREGRAATVFLKDATPDGPASQSIVYRNVVVGRQWRCFRLKARLSARTSLVMVGVQAKSGTLWVDDFAIREDYRAELPW
jgi:hypothetical protein